jgi:chromosome segregation protein
MSSLVPRTAALEALERTVKSLESIVHRQRSDLDRLENELDNLREDRVASSKTREALTRDVQLAEQSLERTRIGIQKTKRQAETFRRTIEKERTILDEIAQKQGEIKRQLSILESEKAKLRVGQRRTILAQMEHERDTAVSEAERLLREQLLLNSKLSSDQSNLETLQPGIDQARLQLRSLESEMKKAEAQAENAATNMKQVLEQEKLLAAKKQEVLKSLESVNEQRKSFEQKFQDNEKDLGQLIRKIDPLNSTLADVKTKVRETELQTEMLLGQLHDYGYATPLEITTIQGEDVLASAMKTRDQLEEELKDIGGINQLAEQQYEMIKDSYKGLSLKINDLEKEKLAIIEFMNEMDRKKLEEFMNSFNRVSQTFQEIFHDITNGGNGKMLLENPDDPFSGGLDVLLEFPGKTMMTIGSASGGEKSVSTVCYLLALQQIHPMPFYIMDEIDAHLDVVNTKRLALLLKSRSTHSQFVVISLKDTTIAQADKVYGVFIDHGESRVISLPSRDVVNN